MKIYSAFVDLQKACDRMDWTVMWDVLKVCDVGGRLLNGRKP